MGLKESGLRGSLRNVSVGIAAIPDTEMFDSPILQFWSGNGIGVSDGEFVNQWDDSLDDLTASAETTDDNILREDKSGEPAVEIGDDGGFNFTPTDFPSGNEPFSVAVLIWMDAVEDNQTIAQQGADNPDELWSFRVRDGNLQSFIFGDSAQEGSTTVPTGQFITAGFVYDPDKTEYSNDEILLLNGSVDASRDTSQNPNIDDNNHSFGWGQARDDPALKDGFVVETLYSNAPESEQAFSDYHEDRIGD